MIHLVLAAIEISNSNLDGMESSFHSSRNGMTPFHSGRNGMSSPFRPEWNGHSIPDRMEWLHSIPTGLEWALHSDRIGHSNPAGLECHSFDNLKKYASWYFLTICNPCIWETCLFVLILLYLVGVQCTSQTVIYSTEKVFLM